MKSIPPGEHYLTDGQLDRMDAVGAGKRLDERPAGAKVDKTGQVKRNAN